jgi:curved DNA-binding protein CbpA
MARQLDELDYYALLGLTRDASVDAIKVAFHDFARRFHPDRHASDPARMHKATVIYRRATEAYRVLTNLDQRRRYDEQLAGGKLRLEASAAGSFRPSGVPTSDSIAPRARPFAARAEQAFKSGDFKQARLNFQIALQHDAQSASLRQRLADVDALIRTR